MKQNLYSNFNKTSKIALLIVLLGIASLFLGTSYAILKGNTTSSNEQVIKAGNVTIKITENFETINKKIKIMSDEVGMLQEKTYDFNIKNIGSTSSKYKLKIINEVPTSNEDEILSLEHIKASLEINDQIFGPFSLGELEGQIDEGIININEVINYKLRIWLDETKQTELQNITDYKAYLKIKVDVNQFIENLDTSGANKPVLSQNMIPVYYDETCDDSAGCWKKADKENSRKIYKWYNYDEKMWANSVTVKETNRNKYLEAELGTKINMDDILTMQVWIPRYKYKVWNYNLNGTATSNPQEIKITFENGVSKTGEITCTDNVQGTSDKTPAGIQATTSEICKVNNANCTDELCNNKTYTHPAFTFGDKNLTGIWVGKFEVSSDINCNPEVQALFKTGCNLDTIRPLVKPNTKSWRGAMVAVFQNNIIAMNNEGNKYGFAKTDNIHMIKNIEWGAVAYLSHSKYGKNAEVEANRNSEFITGCGPIQENNTGADSICRTYNSTLGLSSSTTGNIYGIYDMSGGAHEFTSGNMVSHDGEQMMSGYSQKDTTSQNSGYSGILFSYNTISYNSYKGNYEYLRDEYYDKYTFAKTITQTRSKLGDGIREVLNSTTSWYSDDNHIVIDQYPWFSRGGRYSTETTTGIFNSHYTFGNANSVAYYSSRIAVTQ